MTTSLRATTIELGPRSRLAVVPCRCRMVRYRCRVAMGDTGSASAFATELDLGLVFACVAVAGDEVAGAGDLC